MPVPRRCPPACCALNGHGPLRPVVNCAQSSYGERHPRWVESSARQATITARAEHKFLFVYLHAPEHQVGLCVELLLLLQGVRCPWGAWDCGVLCMDPGAWSCVLHPLQ